MTTTQQAPATTGSRITDEHRRQYEQEGYFVLERVVPEEHLELLRAAAQSSIDVADAAMDAAGTDRLGINAKGKRYFTSWLSRERPDLGQFLFSDLMAEVCRATIGDEAHLIWEQYVIKAGDPDTTFGWHQDSGYVHEDAPAYVTCWVALDDVTQENGSVSLLPYSRSGIRTYVKHVRDERVNDQVCYFGSDPGVAITAPAGSIAVFSSFVIHRSGANRTDRLRRVYLAQYAGEVLMQRDGSAPWGPSVPFLRDGRRITAVEGM